MPARHPPRAAYLASMARESSRPAKIQSRCCGQRNPSSSAAKRMNQQAPGVVRPNSTRMHNENISVSEPFANEPTHNMPLRQLSGWGLTLETGLARELGNLLAAAFRSAPPKVDTDQDGMSLLHRRHRPQCPSTDIRRSRDVSSWKERGVCAAGAAHVRMTGKSWSGKRRLCVPG